MNPADRVVQASQPPAANAPAPAAPPLDEKVEAVPKGEVPKYRVMESCYIADKLQNAGDQIFWTAKPEYYMHPLNAAARNAVRQHKPKYEDPLGKLPIAPAPAAIT